MNTLRQLVSSVDIQLGQVSDDEIPQNQLYLWGMWLVNKYMSYKYQTTDSGAYLTIMPEVAVVKATSTTVDIIAGEKYIILPRTILDLPEDRGIEYITYSRNDYPENVDLGFLGRFIRIRAIKARKLYYSKYEKPTSNNPYWYRHGNYVGLLGVGNINISTIEMGLITSFDPFITHSIDDNIDVLSEFGDEVFKDMVEMGRFALLVTQGEVPRERVTSVNKSVDELFNEE